MWQSDVGKTQIGGHKDEFQLAVSRIVDINCCYQKLRMRV